MTVVVYLVVNECVNVSSNALQFMKISTKGLFKSIQQFNITQKRLGHGSFGVVNLAVHKLTGRLYAIKIINVQDMPSDTEVKLIERQIRIHSTLNHPQCITLWDTIKEKQNVYMILEYAETGNLFYYQNKRQMFSEPQAALFFSQTVKAVQYLHEQDVMHRDLKPQNLLLDSFHNIKLCDFGWCAEDIKAARSTFCGTYQYMAPEMIFASSYDYRIDIWALGILLYQLVQGYAPFRGESVNQVKYTMLQGSYQLSDNFSNSLKELITGILKFDPTQRLTIKQILNCRWLRDMQQIISECSNRLIIDSNSKGMNLHEALLQFQESQSKDSKHHRKNKENNKNISFNVSINNFAYIKNNQRANFVSPGEVYMQKKKKKDDKRCRTQAEEQLMKFAHCLSPHIKKNTNNQSKQTLITTKRQKQQKLKNIQKRRRIKSPEKLLKNPFKTYQMSSISQKTASKTSSVLKKTSFHQKLNHAISSSKNIHKIKTGKRSTQFSNLSTLHY